MDNPTQITPSHDGSFVSGLKQRCDAAALSFARQIRKISQAETVREIEALKNK